MHYSLLTIVAILLPSLIIVHGFNQIKWANNTDSDENNDPILCLAALKAGQNEMYTVKDHVTSLGTSPLVGRTQEAIQRFRTNLGYRCPTQGTFINRSVTDQVLRKIMTRRIVANEWLGASCHHMGFEFEVVRPLNSHNHSKTTLQVVKEKRNRISGEFVMKSFKFFKHFLSEYTFFQFNVHRYMVRPICWLESGSGAANGDVSIIMEKAEPAIRTKHLQTDSDTNSQTDSEAHGSTEGKQLPIRARNPPNHLEGDFDPMEPKGGSASGEFFYGFARQERSLDRTLKLISQLAAKYLLILVHIHANSYVHGDLKPENLMVIRENNGDYSIRLLDFDLSSRLPIVRANAGTRHTISPEVIGAVQGSLTESTEWWSYGMTIAWWTSRALRGWHESQGSNNEANMWRSWQPQIWNGMREEYLLDSQDMSKQLPEQVRCFLVNFFTVDPNRRRFNTRSSIKDLMNDPFFRDVDWAKVIQDAESYTSTRRSAKDLKPVQLITSDFEEDFSE